MKNENIENLIDYSDIGIAQLIDLEIFKEIPLLKSLYSIIRTVSNVKDYFLIKKLRAFIIELENIPADKLQNFTEKMNNRPEYEVNIANKVLFIIDQLDSVEKAKYIGLIFRAFVMKKIDFVMAERLISIINKMFYKDIQNMNYYNGTNTIDSYTEDVLMFNGLISLKIDGGTFGDDSEERYNKLFEADFTAIGKLLVEILFKSE